MENDFDFLIIGSGVIGLTLSLNLSKLNYKVLNIDKEKTYGLGNSSRNTENIHSGIYYKKNSYKHKLCIKGKDMLYNFCEDYKVPFKKCGKIFIATNDNEISYLDSIYKQSKLNEINDVKELNNNNIKDIEPNLNAKAGLLSPSSGVFDSYEFLNKLFVLCQNNGTTFSFKTEFINSNFQNGAWESLLFQDNNFKIKSKNVINASGLNATTLSKKIFPLKNVPKSNPVKGVYFNYLGNSPFTHIIYTPFTPGNIVERIDATTNINNKLIFGPSVEETKDINDYSIDKNLIHKFYNNIKKYFPKVEKSKLNIDQCAYRPKIIYNNDPNPDFQFSFSENNSWLDLWGFESPALTASLAIGEYVKKFYF